MDWTFKRKNSPLLYYESPLNKNLYVKSIKSGVALKIFKFIRFDNNKYWTKNTMLYKDQIYIMYYVNNDTSCELLGVRMDYVNRYYFSRKWCSFKFWKKKTFKT
jgi:hypothetical protein